MTFRTACALLITVALAGCATPKTELTSVAMDKDSGGQFQKVLVLAITDDLLARKGVEQGLAEQISKTGTLAEPAITYIPGDLDTLDRETVRSQAEQAVTDSKADAVLTISLISDQTRDQYTPPQVNQIALPTVEPRFGPYVGYHYDTVVTPGYFTSQREVFIQSDLFDAQTTNVVWRAQSKTMNPTDLETGVEDFGGVMIDRLLNDGMLIDKQL